MITNKVEFLKSFFPETVKGIDFTQINLDITDLSISDVLRNLNKIYPPNSRSRIGIESGEFALGVLCRTETIDPYSGLFLLVCKQGMEINITSCNYIVLVISESRIKSEKDLESLIEEITAYLINTHSETLSNLPEFYKKFVYNESELYADEDYESSSY